MRHGAAVEGWGGAASVRVKRHPPACVTCPRSPAPGRGARTGSESQRFRWRPCGRVASSHQAGNVGRLPAEPGEACLTNWPLLSGTEEATTSSRAGNSPPARLCLHSFIQQTSTEHVRGTMPIAGAVVMAGNGHGRCPPSRHDPEWGINID